MMQSCSPVKVTGTVSALQKRLAGGYRSMFWVHSCSLGAEQDNTEQLCQSKDECEDFRWTHGVFSFKLM